MTRKQTTVLSVWLVGLMLCVSPTLTSCKATPKRVAYETLNAVALTVDSARAAYVDVYRAGTIGAETHARVVALDRKYTVAMTTAIDAARFNWSTPASADLVALAMELVNTIQEVTR